MRVPSSSQLWRITGIFSIISFLLLLIGFLLSLHPQVLAPAQTPAPSTGAASPVQKQPLDNQGTIVAVAFGDSLTRGVGDANGLGYVGVVRQSLEKQRGHTVVLNNLAVNGWQSAQLLAQLDQPQVQNMIKQANLILFTIGGNDLFKQSGGLIEIDKKKLNQTSSTLANNFRAILGKMRSMNPSVPIIYTSLYNPFGDTAAAEDSTQPVLTWNSEAAEIASRFNGVTVVPTYDLFLHKEKAYLYTDHFHPNSDGYKRIADRVLQALQ